MDTNSQERSHTIQLPDGRTLGYLELGEPQGRPIMILHGLPGSRLDGFYIQEQVYSDLNLRAIFPDRPGIGLSDHKAGRVLLDWPNDLAVLADSLRWDRFPLMGISAGGPSALACAYKMPGRITSLTLAASVAPLDIPGIMTNMGPGRFFFLNARRLPWLVHVQFRMLKYGLRKNPAQVMQQVASTLAGPDRAIFDQENIKLAFQASLQEMMRSGTRGMVSDAALTARPWGFALKDVPAPVEIWYGGQDTNAPPQMGKALSAQIPRSTVHYKPEEGHFSLIVNHFKEMIQTIYG